MKVLQSKEKLTESDSLIADCILKNKEKVLEMNVRELAAVSYTSSSSIVRFCRHLGFKGYGEFKIAFAREIEQGLQSVTDVDANFPFGPDDNIESISAKLSVLTAESLKDAQNIISSDKKKFLHAVEILQNAKNRGIFAVGDAYLCGLSFQGRMMRAGFQYLTTPIYGEQGHLAETFGVGDAALLLSYSGTTPKIVECAQQLKKRGTDLIVITAGKDSPLARLSDVLLVLPDREKKFYRLANFSSSACMEYYLNVIYSAFCVNNYAYISKRRID